jgi:RHS repeat-associated protein
MTHTPSGDNTYTYDHYDSNLIQKITYPDGKHSEYAYDDLYRLTNEYATDSNNQLLYTKGYEYDPAENRTGKSNGTLEGYTINSLNEMTSIYEVGEDPHTTFSFDLNGNTVGQTTPTGTTTLEYDYENRLKKITYPSNLGTTDFVYDALGRRLKTKEKNAQGTVTTEYHYVYDGLDLLALLNGIDTLVASITNGTGIDDPLIVRYNGADYFYHKNHQGSVTEIAGINGSVVKTYKYDAFGNIVLETGPAIPGGFTYTGRELHSRSGLYYYRARFYDPRIGRFITQDPIGHLGGVNLYAYVRNEPVRFRDPLGLQSPYGYLAPVSPDQIVGGVVREAMEPITPVLKETERAGKEATAWTLRRTSDAVEVFAEATVATPPDTQVKLPPQYKPFELFVNYGMPLLSPFEPYFMDFSEWLDERAKKVDGCPNR